MPRSDRLFEILKRLRDEQVHRAQDLAAHFGVSTRTIWRDMEALVASGVPVEGTRGAGYRITQAIALPPLTLTQAELEAMTLGLAVVSQASDTRLKEAAGTLGAKLDTALPEVGIAQADAWKVAPSPFADPTRMLAHMPLLRSAIQARQKVRITYTSNAGAISNRVLRPLKLELWGKLWVLSAWCETHGGFDDFRLDLMDSAEALPELFVDEAGKRLEDRPI